MNWYKKAKLIDKSKWPGFENYKILNVVCQDCGKWGTSESPEIPDTKVLWKNIGDLNPEEKQQYEIIKPFLNDSKLSEEHNIALTHGLCPACLRKYYKEYGAEVPEQYKEENDLLQPS